MNIREKAVVQSEELCNRIRGLNESRVPKVIRADFDRVLHQFNELGGTLTEIGSALSVELTDKGRQYIMEHRFDDGGVA